MSVKRKVSAERMHPDLIAAQKLVYTPSGLIIDHFATEVESKEYAAAEFKMNDLNVKFRVAKITPTKVGQFVTLWKRIGKGPIQPFDMADPFDLVVISVRTADHFGQFVFPKTVLYEKGIISKDGKGGKRAIRVYPRWDIADNKQAISTQKWQLLYFFEIPPMEREDDSEYNDFVTHYDDFRLDLMRIYETKGNRTGSGEDAHFFSRTISPQILKLVDEHVAQRYPHLWEVYLSGFAE